jgi:hypothetical protein
MLDPVLAPSRANFGQLPRPEGKGPNDDER